MKRPLVYYPHKILTQGAMPVDFDRPTSQDENRALVEDMTETMYANFGIGLAAPQIGVMKRVIVVDLPQTSGGRPIPSVLHILFNPVILNAIGSVVGAEGCLSVPGVYEKVKRAETVFVRFNNVVGEIIDRQYDGMEARIIQHEIDHLNGTVFLDHLSRLKRGLILKQMAKAARQ